MMRLAKYLKPYLGMVICAIILLFAQANFDLALPDYLSRIVNIGIQQGGIEDAVPQVLRKEQMDKVLLFLNAEEKTLILKSYELVSPSSSGYDALSTAYPNITGKDIYVLTTIDDEVFDLINMVMARGLLAVSTIDMVIQNPESASQMGVGETLPIDLSQIPEGMDVYSIIERLPSNQLSQMMNLMNQRFSVMGEKSIVQAATRAVRTEYEELGVNTTQTQTRYILDVGGIMLLLTLLSGICIIAVGYLSAKTAAGVARDLRSDVFQKVESFSLSEINAFSTASLITRTTNDVTQLQMVVAMMVRMVFFAPIMGVGGIIRALGKGGSLWWLIAIAVAVLIVLILFVMSIALPKFKIIQKLIDRINLIARENLSGMLVIRAFTRQDFEEARFDKANQDLTNVSRFINRLMVVMMPFMMLIMNGLSMAIIWVGAHQIAQASMQVGDLMAFIQYAMQIVMSFLMMTMMFIFIPRAAVSADRIADVLETDPVICDPEDPERFPSKVKGLIEFQNVGFRYPGAEDNVLWDINFTAYPGQTTAFIGSTGCGKSTLVNLILRFYDVSEGSVLIDGVDIRSVTQNELRQQIGYIPQVGTLFSGTVESNLRYADENADDKVLVNAIEIAQASEFIFASADGMQTEIAQGGDNLSGGQKQRMAIARALVKRSSIYIFDDSFSALDFRTDYVLRKALKEKTSGSSILIITQRVSTIMDADQIIVLDNGRIVDKGTHRVLMDNCETYKEIALSQLSMEELA